MLSLARVIRASSTAEYESQEFADLYVHAIRYVCGCISAFAFQRILKTLPITVSAKKFRLELHKSRYTTLDIKLFVYHLCKVRSLTREKAGQYKGVAKRDATMCYLVVSKLAWVRKELKARLAKIGVANPMLTPEGAQDVFNAVYTPVLKYIKHEVYRKLRFVAKSENEEFQDLHNNVLEKVIKAFNLLIPTAQCLAYVVNYLKRAAHNHIQNIIKSATTLKRGRLVNVGRDRNNERQFSLLCTSFNQMQLLTEDGEVVTPDAPDPTSENFELRFSISEVVDRLEAQPRKHRFVLILLGNDDEEFTQWLRANRLASDSEDHVDVQERTEATTFNRLIAEFLSVPFKKVQTFLDKLKDKLQPV